MNVTIYYTELGIECEDEISMFREFDPNLGYVIQRFHLSKQMRKRRESYVEDGKRKRRVVYERNLNPDDYHIHEVVIKDRTMQHQKTYDQFAKMKTPDVFLEKAEIVKAEQTEMFA